MPNIMTTILYNKSDTVNNSVNTYILSQEVYNAGLSSVIGITMSGTDIRVDVSGCLTNDQIMELNEIIFKHEGEDFNNSFQTTASGDDVYGMSPIETKTSEWLTVIDFNSGALREGKYKILWSCEHKLDQDCDGYSSEVRVLVTLPIVGELEVSFDSSETNKYTSFSNGIVMDIVNGGKIIIKLQIRKTGDGDVKAILRRARLVQSLLM